jgi:hypothetical protein
VTRSSTLNSQSLVSAAHVYSHKKVRRLLLEFFVQQ